MYSQHGVSKFPFRTQRRIFFRFALELRFVRFLLKTKFSARKSQNPNCNTSAQHQTRVTEAHQQINTLRSTSSDHHSTAINSNAHRIHQTISNPINKNTITFRWVSKNPFFEDFRGVY
jgi:hypothetical protein